MSKKTVGTMVVGLVLLLGGGAIAGLKTSPGIRVVRAADGSTAGNGSFVAARISSNPWAQVFCGSYPTYSFCTIYPGSGDSASCITRDPNIMGLIRSINSDAYIGLSSDTAGNCVNITFLNDGQYAPKTP